MAIKDFVKELNSEQSVEGELIKTIFYSLLTSFVVLGILYFFKFKNIDNFISETGFFLFLAALSYALIAASVRQVRAYGQFQCMSGMMIGMTTGMIAGFLPGFFVASTNGMFVGSIFGMMIGIGLGIYTGKCCGVMGFMEGVMAGFMGGLMGAMTAFMLFNDNLKPATLVVFLVSSIILFAMNYMIYGETREREREKREDHFFTVVFSFVLTVATTWLMVFGPRTGVFG